MITDNYTPLEYTGNGVTLTFAYTWPIIDKTHIQAFLNGIAKTVDIDFTVDGVGEASGGNVNFLSAPANGVLVAISRSTPLSQLLTFTKNGAFDEASLTAAIDKIVMMMQELKATFGSIVSESSLLVFSANITAGSGTAVITHNLNTTNISIIGISTTWPSNNGATINLNTVSLIFGAPAPGGGGVATLTLKIN